MTDEKNVAFFYGHDAESGEPNEFTEFDCEETDTHNIGCEYREYDK